MSPALVAPTAHLRSSWLQARNELQPGEHIDGSGLLEPDDTGTPTGFAAWTERLLHCADPSVPPAPGRVHSTYRWVVQDDTYLGTIDLRHELNDLLLEAGGHIGYSIRPSARRRGLATWALARTLERARTMGLDRVLLTCDPDNTASAATIERNGSQLEDTRDTVLGPKRCYWIALQPPHVKSATVVEGAAATSDDDRRPEHRAETFGSKSRIAQEPWQTTSTGEAIAAWTPFLRRTAVSMDACRRTSGSRGTRASHPPGHGGGCFPSARW